MPYYIGDLKGDRLNVDVNPCDLQTCFACYNLESWWPAKQSLEAGDTAPWEQCQARLFPCFRLLCKAAAQDVRRGVLEFEAVLAELLTETTMEQVIKHKDSRLAWRRVLGYGAALRACGGCFPVLGNMISCLENYPHVKARTVELATMTTNNDDTC